MTFAEIYSVAATAALVGAAVLLWRRRSRTPKARGRFFAPTPDVNRYLVVMHTAHGDTIECYHGYDGLKARHAYENAPMEPGCRAEFYEWGEPRGRKEA